LRVCEVIQTLLQLDQNSDILFVKIEPYIYASAKLPDGKAVLAELPTGIAKDKHEEN